MEVQRLQERPTAKQFKRLQEKNMPLVFDQLVKHWPAFVKWDPAVGGLEHLKIIAGEFTVQAMLSGSDDPTFNGDIRSHERAALPFGDFIDMISDPHNTSIYLAQVPIQVKGSKDSQPLSSLVPDILVPEFLDADEIANINLWMSCTASRSSIHYDPYHNVLGVVAGQKTITLWPPSAAPYLYIMPLYGEASNHSSVDLLKADYESYPRSRDALKHSRTLTLDAGDALFIPEGWFHQVDSAAVTIAVNFWWPSKIASSFNTHMDAYYLRRILINLLDAEKESMLRRRSRVSAQSSEISQHGEACKIEDIKDLTPSEANQLHVLVSSAASIFDKSVEADLVADEEDPVTRVFGNTTPVSLRRILVVMALKFPRTLEALVLRGLSPAAAELLTRQFEEMDLTASEQQQAEFYKLFYSVFEDPQVAMAVLLDRKEAFAAKALQSVMDRFLNLKV